MSGVRLALAGRRPTRLTHSPCGPASQRPDALAFFDRLQRPGRMWAFLPYIPTGRFDVMSAVRPNISGLFSVHTIAYWNVGKR